MANQLILDSFDFPIDGKSILGRWHDRGIIEIDARRLGCNEKTYQKLQSDYVNLKLKFRQIYIQTICQWLKKNEKEEINNKRLQLIEKIISIIINLEDKSQTSECVLSWGIKYALETTRENNTLLNENYYFTISIGGDSGIPPGVESYFIEPLKKLDCLNKLKKKGLIRFLPRFIIVSTLHAQTIENNRDKSGDDMNHWMHIYNSRITLERVHSFIHSFFPQVASYCDIVEFPSYEKYGFPRLFFFTIYKLIPINNHILDKLFAIKGNVIDQNHSKSDIMKNFFGENANPYVSLHLFYNLIFSHANTLRFGSDATEAQFHVAAMSLYKELRTKNVNLLTYDIWERLEIAPLTCSSLTAKYSSSVARDL